jgi:nucleoside-diphosphate-sugar epimerase
MRKVLITGAAGFVAGILRSHWAHDRYDLRLADIKDIDDADSNSVGFDISDLDSFRSACEGIDTVVHLAADPRQRADFYETLLDRNIVGAYNAFHAAHLAGCRRVVFASSVNSVFGYGGRESTPWDVPIYPTTLYGATKCWGEAVARVYAHEHALSCICVRLGSPRFRQSGDWDPNAPSMGISARDTAQLFARCIDAEDIPFAIVHGISRHKKSWMDLEHSVRVLGYEPEDGTAYEKTSSE